MKEIAMDLPKRRKPSFRLALPFGPRASMNGRSEEMSKSVMKKKGEEETERESVKTTAEFLFSSLKFGEFLRNSIMKVLFRQKLQKIRMLI